MPRAATLTFVMATAASTVGTTFAFEAPYFHTTLSSAQGGIRGENPRLDEGIVTTNVDTRHHELHTIDVQGGVPRLFSTRGSKSVSLSFGAFAADSTGDDESQRFGLSAGLFLNSRGKGHFPGLVPLGTNYGLGAQLIDTERGDAYARFFGSLYKVVYTPFPGNPDGNPVPGWVFTSGIELSADDRSDDRAAGERAADWTAVIGGEARLLLGDTLHETLTFSLDLGYSAFGSNDGSLPSDASAARLNVSWSWQSPVRWIYLELDGGIYSHFRHERFEELDNEPSIYGSVTLVLREPISIGRIGFGKGEGAPTGLAPIGGSVYEDDFWGF